MTPAKYVVMLGASVLSVLLAGCLLANDALVTKDNADYPFEKITVSRGGTPSDTITLQRVGDVYKFSDDKDRLESQFMFKKISESMYVSQQVVTVGKAHVNIYGIIRHEGDLLQTLYCGNYSQATLDKLGIVGLKDDPIGDIIHGKVCQVTQLNQLVALSNEEPDGKREIRTAKIVSIEKK